MKIRDRIKEFRRIPAGELIPNAKNWRRHPAKQKKAIKAVMEEIGFAGALLAREDEHGNVVLIDGHLRAGVAENETVPVLILDVTENEAAKILATFDPLAAMATPDLGALGDLCRDISFDLPEFGDLLGSLVPDSKGGPGNGDSVGAPAALRDQFMIVVTCESEQNWRSLTSSRADRGPGVGGPACRVLVMVAAFRAWSIRTTRASHGDAARLSGRGNWQSRVGVLRVDLGRAGNAGVQHDRASGNDPISEHLAVVADVVGAAAFDAGHAGAHQTRDVAAYCWVPVCRSCRRSESGEGAGGSVTSKNPSRPVTGNGSMGRTSASIHAQARGYSAMHAAASSAAIIGRQSTIRAMQSAFPESRPFGLADAQIRTSPRTRVRQVRVSMVLRPDAMSPAQGCRMERARMSGVRSREPFGKNPQGAIKPNVLIDTRPGLLSREREKPGGDHSFDYVNGRDIGVAPRHSLMGFGGESRRGRAA